MSTTTYDFFFIDRQFFLIFFFTFCRSLGQRAAAELSNVRLDHVAAVTLTRSQVERELQVVYVASDGDVFNMEYLSKVNDFETAVRLSPRFSEHCLLDWSTVKEGGAVFHRNGSAALDERGEPVVGALANQQLAAVAAVEAMMGNDDSEYLMNQTYANMRAFNANFSLGLYPNLTCAWPIGPLRPSQDQPEGTVTVDTDELVCSQGMCSPLGLLTAEGVLDEQVKNNRLALYSTIQVQTLKYVPVLDVFFNSMTLFDILTSSFFCFFLIAIHQRL